MRRFRWVLAIWVILSVLAFGFTAWAENPYKSKKGKEGWDDQWKEYYDERPPGWDKGKKTGWGNSDLPPGQQKKYRQRYQERDRLEYERRRQQPPIIPEPVPVPTPVPVPVPVPVPR